MTRHTVISLPICSAKFGPLQHVYAASVDAKKPTPIPDDTYDALVCCAGFFQGLISILLLLLLYS